MTLHANTQSNIVITVGNKDGVKLLFTFSEKGEGK